MPLGACTGQPGRSTTQAQPCVYQEHCKRLHKLQECIKYNHLMMKQTAALPSQQYSKGGLQLLPLALESDDCQAQASHAMARPWLIWSSRCVKPLPPAQADNKLSIQTPMQATHVQCPALHCPSLLINMLALYGQVGHMHYLAALPHGKGWKHGHPHHDTRYTAQQLCVLVLCAHAQK